MRTDGEIVGEVEAAGGIDRTAIDEGIFGLEGCYVGQ